MNRRNAILGLLAAGVLMLTACTGGEGDAPSSSAPDTLELPSAITSSAASESESENTTTTLTSSQPVSRPTDTSSEENYSNYTAYTENSANAPDINNIHISTSEVFYPTSAREITVIIENRTGWQIVYADDFTLERLGANGWTELKLEPTGDDKAPSFLLDNNRETSLTLDLGRLDGELTVGTYRVSLPMLCNGYAGRFTRSARFTVK